MESFNKIIQENEFNFEEIEQIRLNYFKNKKKVLVPKIIISLVLLIISIWLTYVFYNAWITVIALIIIAIIFLFNGKGRKYVINKFQKEIVIPFFKSALPEMRYSLWDSQVYKKLKKSKFANSSASANCNDCFIGKEQDVEFYLTHLYASERSGTVGSATSAAASLFSGYFFEIKTEYKFHVNLLLKPFNKNTTVDEKIGFFIKDMFGYGYPEMEIGLEEFDARYKTFSDSKFIAKQILTKELRDFIDSFSDGKKKEVYFSIFEDVVYLGLNNLKNAFRFNIKKQINVELLKEYYDILKFLTDTAINLNNILSEIVKKIKLEEDRFDDFKNDKY